MPTWTAKQISDLDNSMVAAQNVSLGTFLAAIAAKYVATGSVVPTAQRHAVTTGLTTVTSVVCSLSASPTINSMWVYATAGSVAGDILIYTYAPTNASTVTPIPATGSFVAVTWTAIGA